MKVAVYVHREETSWRLRISLAMSMDVWWWLDEGCQRAGYLIMLGDRIPLPWAIQLRESFRSLAVMDKWKEREWNSWMRRELKRELEGLSESGEDHHLGEKYMLYPAGREVSRYSQSYQDGDGSPRMGTSLLRDAQYFSQIMEGRQLFADEVKTLWEQNGIHNEDENKRVFPNSIESSSQMGLSWQEAAQLAYLQGSIHYDTGIASRLTGGRRATRMNRSSGRPHCRRCGTAAVESTPCASCGLSACAYCAACRTMGRSRACSLLLYHEEHKQTAFLGGNLGMPSGMKLDKWGLSPAQRAATTIALQFLASPKVTNPVGISEERTGSKDVNAEVPYCVDWRMGWRHLWPRASSHTSEEWLRLERPRPLITGRRDPDQHRRGNSQLQDQGRFLLWAVTGAGKTEMIFPLLDYVVSRGGRALVATPRRDVVLELAPRLEKAFPHIRITVLYGGSTDRWGSGQITLATTHQLMRFRSAFDLVIIDELDAYPYHNDPMLAHAAVTCCKQKGKFVYLSATPPIKLQQEVQRGLLPYAKVPARFHGHPLPVPVRISGSSVAKCLQQRRLPKGLLSSLQISLKRGAQIFVFVTRIAQIPSLVHLLSTYFPEISIAGTSSEDEHRTDKVKAFRAATIRMLVTTTILERGVTIPRSDVYILDADNSLFDEASLVQMAGRAGRSIEDPAGKVIFVSPEWTRAQRQAIGQIQSMNELAHRGGYLKKMGG